MYKEQCIGVVVPAHNEAAQIGGVLTTMPGFVDHIIVVDDCSTDGTFQAATSRNDGRVLLLRNDTNQGVGGSTMAGYEQALRLGCDVIVKMDGDGQMPPDCLTPLLDGLLDGDYDYAKGNRFLIPEALPSMPKLRLFGNLALTFMTKLASGYWHIFDYQNGYTAIRATTLKRLRLPAVHRRYFFENDMLVQLALLRARVKDVAMPSTYGSERSSLSATQTLVTFPALLFRRFLSRMWHNYMLVDFSPVALFLVLGSLLMGWGVLFGAYTWLNSYLNDTFASTGTVMISVLPIVLGFQLLLQAIVLDIQQTPK